LLAAAIGSALGPDDAGLVPAVVARFREIESCAATFSVEIDILVTELDGAVLAPPGRTSVSWRVRAGRAHVRVAGLDLDGLAGRRPGGEASVERLYLPGGTTETLDRASGSWSRDLRSYLDAATLASDLGPGEFVSTFCGSWRSSILAGRKPRVAAVAGEAPGRVIVLEADDRAGGQRIAFECAEAWGLLPRCCRMLAREGGAWRELRRIEVHEARLTRLGWFPAKASLTALRPTAAAGAAPPAFARTTASYVFSEPELAAVAVPFTLAPEAASSRPSDPDPIFSSGSALFREPVAGRGADLEALLRPLRGTRVAAAGRGTKGPASRLLTAGGLALAALGLGGLVFRNRRLVIAAAAAGVASVVWAGALAVAGRRAGGDAATLVAGLARIEAPVPPPSRTLCGVDCLHVALLLAGEAPDYARLLKLVRPGSNGTTLEALAIAAECTRCEAVVVDPRAWSAPPHPLIAHLEPRHFVVVTALRDGEVAVVDPARGIFVGSWEEVRASLSRAACALVPGGPT
jgi:hypothetical protein